MSCKPYHRRRTLIWRCKTMPCCATKCGRANKKAPSIEGAFVYLGLLVGLAAGAAAAGARLAAGLTGFAALGLAAQQTGQAVEEHLRPHFRLQRALQAVYPVTEHGLLAVLRVHRVGGVV